MNKSEYATSDDLNKFVSHVPLMDGLILQILKGHLLVEEIMRELLTLRLKNSEALIGDNGANFDCHQVICLVEATFPNDEPIKWAWQAAKKLNKMRNDLAHQLQPKGLKDKANDLMKYVDINSPLLNEIEGSDLNMPDHARMYSVLIKLCSIFSALKKREL